MKKRIILLVFVMVFSLTCLMAQRVVLSEDLRGETLVSDFGMNRRHYTHNYLGFHFPVGRGERDIAMGRSWTFEYGVRYKRKFTETASGGLEGVLKRSSYHPERFLMPNISGYSYNREKLVFLSIGVAAYQRINFTQRGDYIGRFLDVGFYGDIHYNVRHIVRLDGQDDNLRIRRGNMGLHELITYGVLARVGFNNFVLKGSYRISDIFLPEIDLPEFTRFSVGIELGLHPL